MKKLNQEEQKLLKSVERGEWQSVENLSNEIARYQDYAQANLKKDQQVQIQISPNDLEALQVLAVEAEILYQTNQIYLCPAIFKSYLPIMPTIDIQNHNTSSLGSQSFSQVREVKFPYRDSDNNACPASTSYSC